MLDNPQNKLNQQVNQNTNQVNSQGQKPIPADKPPRLKPDTSIQTPEMQQAEFKNQQTGEITKSPEEMGFMARMKQKIKDRAIDYATSKLAPEDPPSESKPDSNTPNTPAVPGKKTNLPNQTLPNPSMPKLNRPTLNRPSLPNPPKFKR